jgi:hypothetical protein
MPLWSASCSLPLGVGSNKHRDEFCDQTEARHRWFTKPDVTGDLEHPMASGVRNDLDSDLVPIEEVD